MQWCLVRVDTGQACSLKIAHVDGADQTGRSWYQRDRSGLCSSGRGWDQ
jgi:hypothetical protein